MHDLSGAFAFSVVPYKVGLALHFLVSIHFPNPRIEIMKPIVTRRTFWFIDNIAAQLNESCRNCSSQTRSDASMTDYDATFFHRSFTVKRAAIFCMVSSGTL